MANKINDPVSVDAMIKGNLFEKMRFAYIADPDAFINAFSNIGIILDQSNIYNELLTLDDIHKKGADKSGLLKTNSGQPIIFDISKIVDSIQPTKDINVAVY